MRFFLIDRVESLTPHERLTGVKGVSFSEPFLHDHFPEFPVLPGVFMLEAATQASAWLLRLSENFSHSVYLLREAKNIKYASFVQPGSQLRVETQKISSEGNLDTFKVTAAVEDQQTLSGRIVLEKSNMVDRDPAMAETDARILKFWRKAESSIVPPEFRTTSV